MFFPTILACASWALEGSALYVILAGFGSPPTPQLALFAWATSILAGALIPVPGGLGITEGLLEQQLVRLGNVEGSAATAGMILARFATLWFAVLLGFVALGLLRLRFPRLLADEGASSNKLSYLFDAAESAASAAKKSAGGGVSKRSLCCVSGWTKPRTLACNAWCVSAR